MNEQLDYGGGSQRTRCEGSVSGTFQPPKFATRVRTCLTVPVYKLPTVFDPLVHGVLSRVEGGGPPLG